MSEKVLSVRDEQGHLLYQADKEPLPDVREDTLLTGIHEDLSGLLGLLERAPKECLGSVADTPDQQGWYIRDEAIYNVSQLLKKVRKEI